jgi:hypothetical protein
MDVWECGRTYYGDSWNGRICALRQRVRLVGRDISQCMRY